MLDAASGVAPATAQPLRERVRAKHMATRFGSITIDPESVIQIPHGLFGFGGRTRFVITELPDRDIPFKLLQSIEDPSLGFLVLPLVDDLPVARHDLEAAGRRAGIAPEALVALAIVTLRAVPGNLRCTINLKAPVLIDSERRLGLQSVLADERYEVRHPMALDGGTA